MEPKPESSFNASGSERRWVGRSLARAGVHLGQAVTGALASSLDALEERLNAGPKSSGAAQGRMRDLLNQDRALLAVQEPAARVDRSGEDEPEAPRLSARSPVRGGAAAHGRMRELLQRDRVMLSRDDDDDDELAELKRAAGLIPTTAPVVAVVAATPEVLPFSAPECAAVQVAEVVTSPLTVAGSSSAAPLAPAAPATSVAVAPVVPLVAPTTVVASAPVKSIVQVTAPTVVEVASSMLVAAASAASAARRPAPVPLFDNAPVRTRTMAKLLALQGHLDRSLDIYDELIAADPSDAELKAEADRLRK